MATKHSLLRRYRLKKKMTTKQLADLLGLADSTVRSLENGNRAFTAEQAKHIEVRTAQEIMRYELRPDLYDAPRP
jgi:transcriptional regulator with XRE-family HTH domain